VQQLEDIFRFSDVRIGAFGLIYWVWEQRMNWRNDYIEWR
jgi:hypothetical protein